MRAEGSLRLLLLLLPGGSNSSSRHSPLVSLPAQPEFVVEASTAPVQLSTGDFLHFYSGEERGGAEVPLLHPPPHSTPAAPLLPLPLPVCCCSGHTWLGGQRKLHWRLGHP